MPIALLIFAGILSWIVVGDVLRTRAWRKRVRPSVLGSLAAARCRRCASARLGWDGRFRPSAIRVFGGPDPEASVLFRCAACGRDFRYHLETDGSVWQDPDREPDPGPRRCGDCNYLFSGRVDDHCPQCGSTAHVEEDPAGSHVSPSRNPPGRYNH